MLTIIDTSWILMAYSMVFTKILMNTPKSLPSGYVKIAIENRHLYLIYHDLPMKNGDLPSFFVNVYQRVHPNSPWKAGCSSAEARQFHVVAPHLLFDGRVDAIPLPRRHGATVWVMLWMGQYWNIVEHCIPCGSIWIIMNPCDMSS